jgi:hypothetical protein
MQIDFMEDKGFIESADLFFTRDKKSQPKIDD